LLHRDLSISKVNTVRRALDRFKGGGLLDAAAPARVVGIILSDVPEGDLIDVGSGPTLREQGRAPRADALEVLDRAGLLEFMPPEILHALAESNGLAAAATDGPAPPMALHNLVVASNADARRSALAQAEAEGFVASISERSLSGRARVCGARLARQLREDPARDRPRCIIHGGETTVELRGAGSGGRNQELALGAVEGLSGAPGNMLVTLATDGEDGPTDAAGAVVDGSTATRAEALDLDLRAHLEDNDSYTYFAALDDLLRIGPTGTNVADLAFGFRFPDARVGGRL
jgi:hydroxypyruvate reductase